MLIELALAAPRYSQNFEDVLMMTGYDYNNNYFSLGRDLLVDTGGIVVNSLEEDEPKPPVEEPVQAILQSKVVLLRAVQSI